MDAIACITHTTKYLQESKICKHPFDMTDCIFCKSDDSEISDTLLRDKCKREFLNWAALYLKYNGIAYPTLLTMMNKLVYLCKCEPLNFCSTNPVVNTFVSDVGSIDSVFQNEAIFIK